MALLCLGTAAKSSATVWVATSTTIVSTFAKIADGDTVRLSGNFGMIRLSNRSFATGVTLDGSHAKFLDTLDLTNLSGVKLSGAKFDTRGSAASFARALVVYGGSNIVFDRLNFIGDGYQTGLSFAGTNNVTVSNSSFDGLLRGMNIGTVNGGFLTKNKFVRSVSDGIDIGNSHNVLANYNTCSLGQPGPGVHPDCIQMFSAVGQPIQSDNTVIYNSAYGPTQGFTSFSNGGGGLRLTIAHNRVVTSYPQGIACYDCIDSNISYNNVATIPGSTYMTNINVIGGHGNTIIGNYIKPPVGLTKHVPNVIPFDASLDASGDFDGNPAAPVVPVGSPSSVPEPAAWMLLVAGFAVVGAVARRRATRALAA